MPPLSHPDTEDAKEIRLGPGQWGLLADEIGKVNIRVVPQCGPHLFYQQLKSGCHKLHTI